MLTNDLRPAAFFAAGILTLALVQTADAQNCRGGGGGGGNMRTGFGGGYFGGGYAGGGYMGGGYAGNSYNFGGTRQPYGAPGSYQGSSGYGSQNWSGQQPAAASSPTSLNNPATVLAHEEVLNLTGKQKQLLEKMQKSGKQRAALILTSQQRKQLAAIVRPARKSGST